MSSSDQSVYLDLLSDLCREEGIELTIFEQGWVKKLTYQQKNQYIWGYKFSLNPQSAALIADDKFATFAVLSEQKLPIIEHQLLYSPENHNTYAKNHNSLNYVEDYLKQHHNHIVVKPNNGTCGRDVIELRHKAEIPSAIKQVFQGDNSASLCPFYEIKQKYRLVLLDGEVRLIFGRKRVDNWNGDWKLGFQIFRISEWQPYQDLIKIAKKAMGVIGLRFGSVDFIETTRGERLILEVNSGVMTENYLARCPEDYSLVKNIYRDAIRRGFEAV